MNSISTNLASLSDLHFTVRSLLTNQAQTIKMQSDQWGVKADINFLNTHTTGELIKLSGENNL